MQRLFIRDLQLHAAVDDIAFQPVQAGNLLIATAVSEILLSNRPEGVAMHHGMNTVVLGGFRACHGKSRGLDRRHNGILAGFILVDDRTVAANLTYIPAELLHPAGDGFAAIVGAARNGYKVTGLNCSGGLDRFDRLHLTAESCRDLGCQIAHAGIHPVAGAALVRKPSVDGQNHLVGFRRVVQRLGLIAQPEQLGFAVALADIGAKLNTAACIHTVEKNEKETPTEYYNRKLRVFRELVAGTKSILVIDNYSGEINPDLADVIAVGWKVILISRKSPVVKIYTEIPVDALAERKDLYHLFEHNLGFKLQSSDYGYLDNIIFRINGHTLALELIAKQISSSYLSVAEASDLVDTHGFSAMAPEKVIYSKDADAYPETLRGIITALFEADHLSVQMKSLLKVMSLIDSNGIDIRLLHDVLGIESKDDANTLIRDGWMILNDKIISLHPVIQETVHCWEWYDGAKAHAIRLMEFLFRELKAEEHREDYPKKLLWLMEASQELFEKHPRLKKWFECFTENQGYIGETVRQRYERCEDWNPADHEKIAFYVRLSEGILDNCKREPVLLEENIYYDLLYRAVINMPRHREDFIMARSEELLSSPRCQNGFTIMKLYDCIRSIYQERKDFDAAEATLREAEKAAKRFGNNYVWAQYYNLLSAFYDHALGGAYDAIEDDEEVLLKKMMDAIDKTIRYARKSHRPGSKHLLAENLLAKATMLMRSEPVRKAQIDRLLAEAEKIVFAETQPYAEVRCIYYMVKAWYATLIVPSFEDTLVYLSKAEEISKRITPTDLDEIDNMIIPCADMMCLWKRYSYSAEFLMDGIKICEQKETAVPYIRKKMELYRCLLDVCYGWDKRDLCRRIVAEIDDGNRKYRDVGVYVEIPEDLRSLLFSDEPNN